MKIFLNESHLILTSILQWKIKISLKPEKKYTKIELKKMNGHNAQFEPIREKIINQIVNDRKLILL